MSGKWFFQNNHSCGRQEYVEETGWLDELGGSAQHFLASVSSSLNQDGGSQSLPQAEGGTDAIPAALHLGMLPHTQIQMNQGHFLCPMVTARWLPIFEKLIFSLDC